MAQNRFYSSTTKATTTTADPGPTGTTLAVADSTVFASLDGKFPWTAAINWNQADQELVNVTARPSGTTLAIVRGQDGTAGVSHPVGATVTHDVSARDFNEAGAHVGSTAGVHGITGSVVGTTDVQSLTNKTFPGSLILGSTDISAAWQTYTPTWTSSTPPTLGNTTLNGAYLLIGKTCIVSATITVGTTGFSPGSGTYLFGLPFTSSNFTPAVNYTGNARVTYSAVWIGQVSLGNNSNVVNITVPLAGTPQNGGNISATTPAAPAAGNVISYSLIYQVA